MDYRGTVKDGVVVLEAGAELPEGQLVEVTPLVIAESDPLPAAGLWRDRADLGDTPTATRNLRQAANRRSE